MESVQVHMQIRYHFSATIYLCMHISDQDTLFIHLCKGGGHISCATSGDEFGRRVRFLAELRLTRASPNLLRLSMRHFNGLQIPVPSPHLA